MERKGRINHRIRIKWNKHKAKECGKDNLFRGGHRFQLEKCRQEGILHLQKLAICKQDKQGNEWKRIG